MAGGHLQLCSVKSTLLPSQRAVLAMSRAQYLSHRAAEGETPVDKVLVGTCIFRLDGRTLRPAVLLLRRSPRHGRDGAGEWELPGGKVRDEDFCISAAIERLVRETTGLRVIRIMEMLRDVRWRTEIEVLLYGVHSGDDGDDTVGSDALTKIELGSGITVDCHMSVKRKEHTPGAEGLRGADFDVLGIRFPAESTSSAASSVRIPRDLGAGTPPPPPPPPKDDVRIGFHAAHAGYDDIYHDLSLKPDPLDVPRRSPLRPEPYTAREKHRMDRPLPPPPRPGRQSPPPPPPRPRDFRADSPPRPSPVVPARSRRRAPPPRPSYPPLPSQLAQSSPYPPPRNPRRKYEMPSLVDSRRKLETSPPNLRRQENKSFREKPPLETLPTKTYSSKPRQGSYRTRLKTHLQLNFAVLVDEEDVGEDRMPKFLLRQRGGCGEYGGGNGCESGRGNGDGFRNGSRDGSGDGNRNRDEDGDSHGEGEHVFEHDALEWATWARVEALPMNEDLRRVCFQGLEWMERLTGGFF